MLIGIDHVDLVLILRSYLFNYHLASMAGTRRQRRVRRRRGRRTRLRLPFNGGLVRGRMHPSTTSASPWNMYTVTTIWQSKNATDKGIICLGKQAIAAVVKTELGLSTDAIDMRITRMDIWTPPAFQNNDSNCIVFSPSDWTSRDDCKVSNQLNWFEAWGTSVQPAHAHYVWPKSIATQVMHAESEFEVARFDIIAGQQFLLKIHLMWRYPVPNPRPDSVSTLLSVRESRRRRACSPDHEFEDLATVAQLAI